MHSSTTVFSTDLPTHFPGSRNLADESDESSQLVLNQKIDCIRILKEEIHYLKTYKPDEGWFSYSLNNWDWDLYRPKNPLPWNRERILMLLRNAYRTLRGTPLGLQVFLDPYTVRILHSALESKQYDGENDEYDDDIVQILEILSHSMTQMVRE